MNTTSPHRTRTLWLTGVLHVFTHLYHVALLPLYILIRHDEQFGLKTVEEATFLMTVLMLSYYVPSYWMGVLADRFSKRKLLAMGLAINAMGFIALAVSQNFGQAIASVVISGIGGSFFHPCATSLIARLFPEATGKAFGLLGIGASAGFFLGPIYTGWRGSMSGWREPVLEIGIFGLVVAVLFYFLADEEPPHEACGVIEGSNGLFPSGMIWALFLIAAFCFSLRDFAGSAMGSLGSLFLQKAHGLDTAQTGQILSMIFLASAVSNPIFGRLSDRGAVGWTTFVLMIAGGMIVLFPHLPVKFSAPALAFYGFFFMASYPMVEAALMGAVPHRIRGRVFGLFITIGGFFGNLAHWLSGSVVRRMGGEAVHVQSYHGLYVGLGVLVGISLLGLPCLRKLREKEKERGEPVGNLSTAKL